MGETLTKAKTRTEIQKRACIIAPLNHPRH